MAASFLALVRTRVELAVVELQEEGERRKEMLLLAAVGGVFLALAALLFALFVVVACWETHRVAAAGGMTVLYLAIGAYAFVRLRKRAAGSPPPFEATLAELRKDMEALRGGDE